MRLTPLLVAATLVASSSSAVAGPISAVYVFGDSLSDNGNFTNITTALGAPLPLPPYGAGRASNGLVAVEHLAQLLGLPLTPGLDVVPGPNLNPGTNYSVIGAASGPVEVPGTNGTVTVDNITQLAVPAFPPSGLPTQLAVYVAELGVQPIDPDALFVIWAGANDLFINPSLDTADDAAENIQNAIGQLYGLGARRFLVPNLPDLGLPPGGFTGLSLASARFNTALAARLVAPGTLPGIQLVSFDSEAFFNRIAQDPGLYGFTNVEDECFVHASPNGRLGLGGGTACQTPGSYLFWDQVHPTAAAHRQLGEAFFEEVAPLNNVPEPLSLTLAGLGVAALALRRRRA